MTGLSAADELAMQASAAFTAVVRHGLMKLMAVGVVDALSTEQIIHFSRREKEELVATFILADNFVKAEERVWIDISENVSDNFNRRIQIDPVYWAKDASDVLRLLAEYDPELAAQYAEHAIVLARAICALDSEISSEEAALLLAFNKVLAQYASIDIDPVAVSEASSVVQHHVGVEHDLEATLKELDTLVGLSCVKADVRQLANILHVGRMRTEAGLATPDLSLHLVFTGNPGTGKTTVARILGRIYAALGVLSNGHLVEASRTDLVAGYVGQTAIKTTEVFNRARGGVLFIDEAYSLNRGGVDYGQEAIDTLVKLMEDYRDQVVVIVAGYPVEMDALLGSNPGLPSRFKRTIHFADYSAEELGEIYERICEDGGYALADDSKATLHSILASLPRDLNFGNGRVVRQMFETAIGRHANRVTSMQSPSIEALSTLLPEDIIDS